jgi:hypothetical protein
MKFWFELSTVTKKKLLAEMKDFVVFLFLKMVIIFLDSRKGSECILR